MYPPKLKRYFVCFAALVAALFLMAFLSAQETYAGTKTVTLTVSARVLPYVQLKLLSQVSEINITSTDIQRGYVDLPAASRLEVRNNDPAGYLLTFTGSLGPFREVLIQGLANEVQLNSGNGFVLQPYSKGKRTMELSYRFIIPQDTKPGFYSWPFSISAQTV